MASAIEEVLHSAYSFIRGVEANKSVASLTLDHLIQQQIDAIKGGGSRVLLDAAGQRSMSRRSKLDLLNGIETDIDRIVKAVEDAGEDEEKLYQLGLQAQFQSSTTPK